MRKTFGGQQRTSLVFLSAPSTGAVLIALIFCTACRSAPTSPVRIDLLQQFAATDSRQEILNLDLGDPAAAAHLGRGWSPPMQAPSGETILRSAARKLVIRATVHEPHDRLLIVRCGTLAPPEMRSQVVAVRVNGRRIGTLTVDGELREYTLPMPARFQHRGENEIAFGMRMGRGKNRLPVAYDTVRIVSPESMTGPVPSVRGDRLLLPAPSAVEYFVRVPAQTPTLQFGLHLTRSPGTLHVTAASDALPDESLLDSDHAGAKTLDLSRYAGQITRLRFTTSGRDGLLELESPLLLGARFVPAPPPRPTATGPSNVVIFLVDTLRADHLSCYGYAKSTSPRIDAFARQGILFTRTVAQASWTRPSVASVMTGLNPQGHGAVSLRDRLDANVPTLAESLRANGYRTGAFVTNVNVAPTWGFQRGFDTYRYFPEDSTKPRVHVGADEIEGTVFEWLAGQRGNPFFLYVHVTDPHAPYVPPSPYIERFVDPSLSRRSEEITARLQALKRNPTEATAADLRALKARYDGEIGFIDAYFGRLLDELARLGHDDDTLVIFLADHGEEFMDHGGFEHGRTLFNELLHIPLVLRLPHQTRAGERIDALARQVDVMPTVLDVVGVALPPGLQGRSLLAAGAHDSDDIEALAQTSLGNRNLEALITGNHKVIQVMDRDGAEPQIYALGRDPRERDNQQAKFPILLGYARQRLSASAGERPPHMGNEAAPIEPAIVERLRALGYAP